ncbi:hypothetical protein AOLI_G00285610 [Acnodon oligacanthus]
MRPFTAMRAGGKARPESQTLPRDMSNGEWSASAIQGPRWVFVGLSPGSGPNPHPWPLAPSSISPPTYSALTFSLQRAILRSTEPHTTPLSSILTGFYQVG